MISTKNEKISIVIPVYDETKSLVDVVDNLVNELGDIVLEFILILSPKAPKLTVDICNQLSQVRSSLFWQYQIANPGYGRAVRQGLKIAKGDGIVIIDADGELDPLDAKKLYEKFQDGYDLVIASRWMEGGDVIGYGKLKIYFTKLYSKLFRRIFNTQISDLSLGYKLIRNNEFFRQLKFTGNYHDLATETSIRPIKAGFKSTEVPTTWTLRKEGGIKKSAHKQF